jgi:hypothetical protein
MTTSVRPEMGDFGSGQGLSVFAIPPKAGLSATIPRIAEKRKRCPGPIPPEAGQDGH